MQKLHSICYQKLLLTLMIRVNFLPKIILYTAVSKKYNTALLNHYIPSFAHNIKILKDTIMVSVYKFYDYNFYFIFSFFFHPSLLSKIYKTQFNLINFLSFRTKIIRHVNLIRNYNAFFPLIRLKQAKIIAVIINSISFALIVIIVIVFNDRRL